MTHEQWHVALEGKSRLELFNHISALRAALKSSRALIESATLKLSTYIVPDSGISDQDLINDLLGIFDGPEQRAAALEAVAALQENTNEQTKD